MESGLTEWILKAIPCCETKWGWLVRLGTRLAMCVWEQEFKKLLSLSLSMCVSGQMLTLSVLSMSASYSQVSE